MHQIIYFYFAYVNFNDKVLWVVLKYGNVSLEK